MTFLLSGSECEYLFWLLFFNESVSASDAYLLVWMTCFAEGISFSVEVLVFSVSSRDAEVLGDQSVIGFLSTVRKPLGSSHTLGFASDDLI